MLICAPIIVGLQYTLVTLGCPTHALKLFFSDLHIVVCYPLLKLPQSGEWQNQEDLQSYCANQTKLLPWSALKLYRSSRCQNRHLSTCVWFFPKFALILKIHVIINSISGNIKGIIHRYHRTSFDSFNFSLSIHRLMGSGDKSILLNPEIPGHFPGPLLYPLLVNTLGYHSIPRNCS